MARQLIINAIQKPIRWLCCRETMHSIEDSVHQLLCDQIANLNAGAHFHIIKNRIEGINGSLITYAGLRTDAGHIKSYENYDGAWVEEAAQVSKRSWEILLPTIRKAGSEIWVSFNPELPDDDTYKRWVITPPPGAVVVKTSWRDADHVGWLSSESKSKIMHMQKTDPEGFQNIYEGDVRQNVEGAIYAKELAAVDREGRITQVPADPLKPVQTFWDIGDRFTSIWFAQQMPFQVRVLDYQDGEGLGLKEHVKLLRERDYIYGTMWLPHDAKSPQLGTGKSIEEQLRGYGFQVRIVPRLSITARINALRTVFPTLWFDSEKCADGLQGIRHYRWPPDGAQGQLKREPLHDWASHPGDAATYMAVAIRGDVPEDGRQLDPVAVQNEIIGMETEYGWMQ